MRYGFGAVYRSIAEHHMQPAFGTGGAVKKNTHGFSRGCFVCISAAAR